MPDEKRGDDRSPWWSAGGPCVLAGPLIGWVCCMQADGQDARSSFALRFSRYIALSASWIISSGCALPALLYFAPQFDLGDDRSRQIANDLGLFVGPGSRMMIDNTERAERRAVRGRDRHSKVGNHVQVADGKIVLDQWMSPRIGYA
jgi:hypothetical protein